MNNCVTIGPRNLLKIWFFFQDTTSHINFPQEEKEIAVIYPQAGHFMNIGFSCGLFKKVIIEW